MTERLELPKFQAFDANGDPLSGGLVYTYEAGTSTLKTTYSDYDASTANANPIVLDSRGEAVIYVRGSYKIVLKDSAGVTLWTMDNVQGGVGSEYAAADYYYPSSDAADHGVTGSSDTIKYAVDTLSGDSGTIYLKHDSGSATTTYTLTTSESIPSTIRFVVENGAVINGAGTITFDNPGQIISEPGQQIFGSSITVAFNKPGIVYPQLWGGPAINDGSTNATPSVRKAIAALQAGSGGTVKLIAGVYKCYPQASGENVLTIANGTDFTLMGEGMGTTKIDCYALSGADPEANWENIAGATWRGSGIKILGGANSGATTKNITIKDLELDGNCLYTGDNTSPAPVGTGDGLDITHKGIFLEETNKYHDNIRIENCEIHHWKGELIYGGGIYISRVTSLNNILHDSNGNGWSVSGQCNVQNTEMYTLAAYGIEDVYVRKACQYRNNYIHDADVGGASFTQDGGGESYGPCVFENNLLVDIPKDGIYGLSLKNCFIKNNIFIDCASTTNYRCINIANGSQRLENIHITGNTFISHDEDLWEVMSLVADTTLDAYGIVVKDNIALQTKNSVDDGNTFNTGYTISGDFDASCIFENNRCEGSTYIYTDESRAIEELLTTTNATVIARQRPYRNGFFQVDVAYRIITGATNITINVSWYDDAGTALNEDVVSEVAKAVGSYRVASITVLAGGDTEAEYVKVTATAGTANQVYVSANIRDIGLRGQNNN